MPRARGALALLAGWLAAGPVVGAGSIADPGQGPVGLPAGDAGATELGGVSWVEGRRFVAVSDESRRLFELEVDIDRESGRITGAAVTGYRVLDRGVDLEGVAWEGRGTLYVADEVGPALRRHDAASGRTLDTLRVPPIFASARRNLSLESLTRAPDGSALWTANEEALPGDGPTNLDSGGSGTRVRLQRLRRTAGGGWRAAGQWAYTVDAVGAVLGRAPSGVVDLLALPGGALLVLERAAGAVGVGGDPPTTRFGFRSRLYRVDPAGATDTSRLAALGRTVRPVGKTLMWERVFSGENFEGLTLGPALADGGRSIILVSDDGNGLRQSLYALRLRSEVP